MHLTYFFYEGTHKYVLILEKTEAYIFGVVINSFKTFKCLEIIKAHNDFLAANKMLMPEDDNLRPKLLKEKMWKNYTTKIDVDPQYYQTFEVENIR